MKFHQTFGELPTAVSLLHLSVYQGQNVSLWEFKLRTTRENQTKVVFLMVRLLVLQPSLGRSGDVDKTSVYSSRTRRWVQREDENVREEKGRGGEQNGVELDAVGKYG
jgi:hypothetical protein